MKAGFYKFPEDLYHRQDPWQKFISRSRLHRTLEQSPAHGLTEQPDKPSYKFGRDFHKFIFEEKLFHLTVAVTPEDHDGRTKVGKAWIEDHRNMPIVTFNDYIKFCEMGMAIRRHKTAHDLLKDGEAELSGCWQDPKYTEITCKLRIDWVNKKERILVDLKKVQDCRRFERDAYKYGYDMQAAWYLYGVTHITGVEHTDFYFICVEEPPPHGVMVYKASDEFIASGLLRCAKALDIIKECQDAANWPCYPDEIKELNLPLWAREKKSVIYEGGF
jgi:hypothetical protein